jgi:hypothetical protein
VVGFAVLVRVSVAAMRLVDLVLEYQRRDVV